MKKQLVNTAFDLYVDLLVFRQPDSGTNVPRWQRSVQTGENLVAQLKLLKNFQIFIRMMIWR